MQESSNSKFGKKWSEEETILTFFYYCKIPFGQIYSTNPKLIRLANLLGRTPGSVAIKMGNLAHFDPELKKRNIKGFQNASKTDAIIVERFCCNWEELTYQANLIEKGFLASVEGSLPVEIAPSSDDFSLLDELSSLPPGEIKLQITRTRVNQDFFRRAVLASYQNKCCLTGINHPELLVASHIKPWKDCDPQTERTNPCNGLCLNALHDKAFDRGLITVLPDFTVRLSSKLASEYDKVHLSWLLQCDRKKIELPEKFIPSRDFLEYHNDVIFVP